MIAVAKSSCAPTNAAPPKFEDLLPAITRQARIAFRHLPASESEELIAETIANCFVAFTRLVKRGLGDVIYPTPLVQFAIRQVRSGRRVGTKLNKNDVTSEYCQLRRDLHVERLDNCDEKMWQEVLVEDRSAGPAEIAASRIDFSEWLRSLTAKKRRIAETLATGEPSSIAARKFRVSPARISQLRRELMECWEEFHRELRPA